MPFHLDAYKEGTDLTYISPLLARDGEYVTPAEVLADVYDHGYTQGEIVLRAHAITGEVLALLVDRNDRHLLTELAGHDTHAYSADPDHDLLITVHNGPLRDTYHLLHYSASSSSGIGWHLADADWLAPHDGESHNDEGEPYECQHTDHDPDNQYIDWWTDGVPYCEDHADLPTQTWIERPWLFESVSALTYDRPILTYSDPATSLVASRLLIDRRTRAVEGAKWLQERIMDTASQPWRRLSQATIGDLVGITQQAVSHKLRNN